MKQKRFLKVFAVYSFAVGSIAVLTFAKINTVIAPFAIAFCFATLFLPVRKEITAAAAFFCALFTGTGREYLLSIGFACIVFVAFAWTLPRLRKKYTNTKSWNLLKLEYTIVIAAYIFSNVLNLWFVRSDTENLYQVLISIITGAVFLFCCIVFIQTAHARRTRIPWTADQKICTAVFVTIFALGLCGLESDCFSVHRFVTVVIILTGIALFKQNGTLAAAVCLGLGKSLVALNLNYVAIYVILALSAMAFKQHSKYLSAIAVIAADTVLGIYFGAYINYSLSTVLSLVAACTLVVFFPYRFLKYFDFSKNGLTGYIISKNTIDRNRAGIYGRLNHLSGVFNEMQHVYKGLVQGSVSAEENSKIIASHIIENICDSCQNKPSCKQSTSSADEILQALQKLAHIGLRRGNISFLDLPPILSMKCIRINAVLANINNLLEQIKTREKITVSLDASKVLMAGLLTGVSKLCKTFADDVCQSVVFDIDKAELIKNELLQKGIAASDCLITRNSLNEYSVSVLVARSEAQNKSIEQSISNVCGHKMQTDSIDDSQTAGFSVVTVRTAPRYILVFGVAQVAKDYNSKNGDTFSFLKIAHDKTMMAVCDGMGAGERAERASVLALSLVENFYKAGFPDEIIMISVNQLLTITQQEVFSALDIAVFNLCDGCVNFIKVGATDGFIKRAREVEVVEAGSLPIGIVEEMTPKITRAVLSCGDTVVLCSDGVVDSFGGRIALANFINNLTFETPQMLADEIIQECINRTSNITGDDCTVTAARIMER